MWHIAGYAADNCCKASIRDILDENSSAVKAVALLLGVRLSVVPLGGSFPGVLVIPSLASSLASLPVVVLPQYCTSSRDLIAFAISGKSRFNLSEASSLLVPAFSVAFDFGAVGAGLSTEL